MSDEPIKRGRGRPRKPKPDVVPPKRPVGRPVGSTVPRVAERQMTVREYAMTHVFTAIDTLATIMEDETAPETARIGAANHILNRAIGQAAVAQAGQNDTADQVLQAIRREIVDPVKREAPAKGKADA